MSIRSAIRFGTVLWAVLFISVNAYPVGFYTTLLEDIGQFDISSNPRDLVDFNGVILFSANDNIHGTELWKSDGTEIGTVLVKDVFTGLPGGNPRELVSTGSLVFFVANGDGGAFDELWKSDGTADGTVIVKDIYPGNASYPTQITAIGNKVFFAAEDGVHGQEPWVSDGSEVGTFMLKDIHPDGEFSNPQHFTELNGIVYFIATDPVNGRELWRTDGTVDGTFLLKDINEGIGGNGNPRNSSPAGFTAMGNFLYFSAQTATEGSELWKTDGTENGTVLVRDINAGSGTSLPRDMVNLNGMLLFAANGPGGQELWRSDGSSDGTVRVMDIRPGSSGSSAESLTIAGDLVFFRADDGTNGTELWTSDGTEAGTSMVADISLGNASGLPIEMTALDHRVVFKATASGTGEEVWISDGTTVGTFLLRDIFVGASGSAPLLFTRSGNQILFRADNGFTGAELWVTDGTPNGTQFVKGINETVSGSSANGFFEWNGVAYFSAEDGFLGHELWRSDGTADGTEMVRDILPGSSSSSPSEFTPFDGALYFAAAGPGNGLELWKTDGLTDGTVEVADIRSGSNGSSPNFFTVLGNQMLYVADDGTHGPEWWKTAAGDATSRVSDINPDGEDPLIDWPAVLGNVVLFGATNGVTGHELWKTDGTELGTELVKDINENAGDSLPSHLTPFNSIVLFSADDGVDGAELWKTDGTPGGTSKVLTIRAGEFGSDPRDFTVVGSVVYFAADDGDHGVELWKTDGTPGGTSRVKDIFSGTGSANPEHLTEMNGKLYFAANSDVINRELWVSDGTEAGTVQVAEIRDSSNGSDPQFILAHDGILYFSATSGFFQSDSGQELWASDGTEAGTRRVEDIFLGSESSNPMRMTALGDNVIFTADNGMFGDELWITHPGAPEIAGIDATGPLNSNASTVGFEITFTKAVTGVDASDFELDLSSKVLNGVLITGVSGSGDTYIVQIDTGNGIGEIGLRLVDDDSILGAAPPILPLAGPSGNSATMTSADRYVIDKEAPSITVTALATQAFNPALNGTVADPNADVTIEVNGTVVAANVVGTTWNTASGAFPNFPEGKYNVIATAIDTAGNTGTDGTTDELTIDQTPPGITLTGNAYVLVIIGDPYVELGAVGVDNLDPSPVTLIGGDVVNDQVEAFYSIVYRAEDGAGNLSGPVFRTVNVSHPTGGASGIYTPGQALQLSIETGPLRTGFLTLYLESLDTSLPIGISYEPNPPAAPPGWRLVVAAAITPAGTPLIQFGSVRIPYVSSVPNPLVRVAYFDIVNNRWETDGISNEMYFPEGPTVEFDIQQLATYGLFVPGSDVNGDQVINAVDVQLVINAALGTIVPGINANVDNDPENLVNAVDVQISINQALGLF